MIVSKQSLINAAARDILHAAQLDHQENVEKALVTSGTVLYGNVVEIDKADQMEILASIRDTVSSKLDSTDMQDLNKNRHFSTLLAYFVNGFVDASETMGLSAIDHGALRISVANTLGNVDAAHVAGTN
jgi:hypothetical protein